MQTVAQVFGSTSLARYIDPAPPVPVAAVLDAGADAAIVTAVATALRVGARKHAADVGAGSTGPGTSLLATVLPSDDGLRLPKRSPGAAPPPGRGSVASGVTADRGNSDGGHGQAASPPSSPRGGDSPEGAVQGEGPGPQQGILKAAWFEKHQATVFGCVVCVASWDRLPAQDRLTCEQTLLARLERIRQRVRHTNTRLMLVLHVAGVKEGRPPAPASGFQTWDECGAHLRSRLNLDPRALIVVHDEGEPTTPQVAPIPSVPLAPLPTAAVTAAANRALDARAQHWATARPLWLTTAAVPIARSALELAHKYHREEGLQVKKKMRQAAHMLAFAQPKAYLARIRFKVAWHYEAMADWRLARHNYERGYDDARGVIPVSRETTVVASIIQLRLARAAIQSGATLAEVAAGFAQHMAWLEAHSPPPPVPPSIKGPGRSEMAAGAAAVLHLHLLAEQRRLFGQLLLDHGAWGARDDAPGSPAAGGSPGKALSPTPCPAGGIGTQPAAPVASLVAHPALHLFFGAVALRTARDLAAQLVARGHVHAHDPKALATSAPHAALFPVFLGHELASLTHGGAVISGAGGSAGPNHAVRGAVAAPTERAAGQQQSLAAAVCGAVPPAKVSEQLAAAANVAAPLCLEAGLGRLAACCTLLLADHHAFIGEPRTALQHVARVAAHSAEASALVPAAVPSGLRPVLPPRRRRAAPPPEAGVYLPQVCPSGLQQWPALARTAAQLAIACARALGRADEDSPEVTPDRVLPPLLALAANPAVPQALQQTLLDTALDVVCLPVRQRVAPLTLRHPAATPASSVLVNAGALAVSGPVTLGDVPHAQGAHLTAFGLDGDTSDDDGQRSPGRKAGAGPGALFPDDGPAPKPKPKRAPVQAAPGGPVVQLPPLAADFLEATAAFSRLVHEPHHGHGALTVTVTLRTASYAAVPVQDVVAHIVRLDDNAFAAAQGDDKARARPPRAKETPLRLVPVPEHTAHARARGPAAATGAVVVSEGQAPLVTVTDGTPCVLRLVPAEPILVPGVYAVDRLSIRALAGGRLALSVDVPGVPAAVRSVAAQTVAEAPTLRPTVARLHGGTGAPACRVTCPPPAVALRLEQGQHAIEGEDYVVLCHIVATADVKAGAVLAVKGPPPAVGGVEPLVGLGGEAWGPWEPLTGHHVAPEAVKKKAKTPAERDAVAAVATTAVCELGAMAAGERRSVPVILRCTKAGRYHLPVRLGYATATGAAMAVAGVLFLHVQPPVFVETTLRHCGNWAATAPARIADAPLLPPATPSALDTGAQCCALAPTDHGAGLFVESCEMLIPADGDAAASEADPAAAAMARHSREDGHFRHSAIGTAAAGGPYAPIAAPVAVAHYTVSRRQVDPRCAQVRGFNVQVGQPFLVACRFTNSLRCPIVVHSMHAAAHDGTAVQVLAQTTAGAGGLPCTVGVDEEYTACFTAVAHPTPVTASGAMQEVSLGSIVVVLGRDRQPLQSLRPKLPAALASPAPEAGAPFPAVASLCDAGRAVCAQVASGRVEFEATLPSVTAFEQPVSARVAHPPVVTAFAPFTATMEFSNHDAVAQTVTVRPVAQGIGAQQAVEGPVVTSGRTSFDLAVPPGATRAVSVKLTALQTGHLALPAVSAQATQQATQRPTVLLRPTDVHAFYAAPPYPDT